MSAKSKFRLLLATATLMGLALSGCSSIRVPAIDPTGERIFAPGHTYTTLESPCQAFQLTSCLPRPAYGEPSPVPACPTHATTGVIGTIPVQPLPATRLAAPNVPDRLLLTPAKIVAPVGSEVVLLAGLCGSDGHYLTKQPIEWLLSQESVGHFVDVGESDHPTLAHLLHKTPEKRSSNFAVSRTSTHARTITRGTPATTDDIWLQKGQTWVTLTAASEGTSHVTAVAPEATNWEQRRQTATIHWVDAQWMLPAPAVVRAGQSHVLTTTITRSSSIAPAPGWQVKYEIVGGPAAGFGPERAQSLQIVTDANGKAPVSVQPLGNEPGVTQIRIEILSPALSGVTGQAVAIGQGTTTITWSAAGLAVRIVGPSMGAIDSTLDYQIIVTNPGDLPTENVVVTAEVPPLLRVIGSQEGVVGANVEWGLDRLAPRGTQQFNLQCRAMASGDVRLFARAAATGITSERARFDTQIVASALRLTMDLAGGIDPNQIKVGDQVSFNVGITNTSNVPLTNVRLRDVYSPGLQEAHGEPSPIIKSMGNLAPGASQQVGITFVVRQPGELCHTLEATADGGHTTSLQRCIRAGAPRYELTLDLRGPEEVLTNAAANYEIVVKNSGEGELTGVRIVYRADQALLPKLATDGYVIEAGALVWTIPALAANETQLRTVRCEGVAATNVAETRVSVGTDQGLTQAKRMNTAIRQAAASGVAPPGPARPEPRVVETVPQTNPAPVDGNLVVTVADTADPIRVGESTVYIIEVQNNRQVSDKNVQISLFLSAGAKFVTLSDSKGVPVEGMSVRPDGLAVSLPPIKELRPGEKFPPLRMQVEGRAAGVLKLDVEVTSNLSGNVPVTASHETVVAANR